MLTADRSALAYVAMALATMPLSLIGYIGGYALALAVGPLDPRLDTIIGFTWWAFIGVGQAALGLFVATKRSETRAQRISY
jgi:hypothetical protein